jgi:23S rRNA-/tRNA-specific pseudouridylate synthase
MVNEPHVIDRDNTLWVLSKPAGLLVHAAEGGEPDLMSRLEASEPSMQGVAPCHRLDRSTSGVVLASTDPAERGEIGKLFAAGEVEKRYLALVFGVTHGKGSIKRPLKRGRKGGTVTALTRYRRLEVLGGFSLLEVSPKSGRKHQIRRHLQGIGHSIVGDRRYGPKRFRRVPGYPDRLWLHASQVILPDGRSFEAPLPAELAAHLDVLRQGARSLA